MQVKETTTKDVDTVLPDTPVKTVARLFREGAICGVPVADDEGERLGIITEMDLSARHARPHFPSCIQLLDSIIYLDSGKRYHASMRHILATSAGELMTTPVRTADPDMDIQDRATFTVERRANPVPVVDDEAHLVGIVSNTGFLHMIERAEAAGP